MNESSQSNCDNCGTLLEGEFCHCCGQRKIDFKSDWKKLTVDFFCSFINFDGKLLVGLADLAFRPWRLIQNYLSGKRTSQIPPVRVYLFVSLFAIVVASEDAVVGFKHGLSDDKTGRNDVVIAPIVVEAGHSEAGVNQENAEGLLDFFFEWLPRLFLLGVFALALLIKLFLARQHLVYLECLVVAIYMQSFAFLWTALMVGWGSLVELLNQTTGEMLMLTMMLWFFVCPIISVKKIFNLASWKAIILSILIGLIHFAVLIAGMVVLGVASAAMNGLI